MIQAIGFANKFYTLWSIEKQPVYITDSYGKHWISGYNMKYYYHKNISFDLEKSMAAHPDLEVMEDLRGKTQSWERKSEDDLCPQIMKFGKYYGKDINELLDIDFLYIIWLCENSPFSSNGKYAMELPRVKDFFQERENAINKVLEHRKNIFADLLRDGFYEFTAERNLSISPYGYAAIMVNINGVYVNFKFSKGTYSLNEYNGHEYGLPIVNGKAKRMKGKTFRFEFTEDKSLTTDAEIYDNLSEFKVMVKNVVMIKQNQPA